MQVMQKGQYSTTTYTCELPGKGTDGDSGRAESGSAVSQSSSFFSSFLSSLISSFLVFSSSSSEESFGVLQHDIGGGRVWRVRAR